MLNQERVRDTLNMMRNSRIKTQVDAIAAAATAAALLSRAYCLAASCSVCSCWWLFDPADLRLISHKNLILNLYNFVFLVS